MKGGKDKRTQRKPARKGASKKRKISGGGASRIMENSRRLIVSSKEINADALNNLTSLAKRIHFKFVFSCNVDDPRCPDVTIVGIRHIWFSLASFSTSPNTLEFSLSRLFLRFPEPGTFWRDCKALSYPIAGLAGASEKIMQLCTSMLARGTGASLMVLVKIQKLITLTWPEDFREWDSHRRDAYCLEEQKAELNHYFDGETKENDRIFIRAKQIMRTGDAGIMYMAIELSHRIEKPLGGQETSIETRQFSFPIAAFDSPRRARTVIEPVLAGLGIRFPVLGTAWCNNNKSGTQSILGVAGAADRIAELGALMRSEQSATASLEMYVKIEKWTIMMRPENPRHFNDDDWNNYYAKAFYADMARYFDGETVQTTRNGRLENACPICMDDMEIGERHAIQLLCSHWFHGKCIGKWVEKTRTCPYCRSALEFSTTPS